MNRVEYEENHLVNKTKREGNVKKEEDIREGAQKNKTERTKDTRPIRRIPVPPNRFSPLKGAWIEIYKTLTEQLKLQVRMNTRYRCVELRESEYVEDEMSIQKGEEFIRGFMLGFEVQDAMALVRLDDMFIESFEIKDVKPLHGDHLSRAIARIAGTHGKTKHAIENASKTRIVLADDKIHIMGSYQNIKIARSSVVSLILGSPAGVIYNNLRIISSRLKEKL